MLIFVVILVAAVCLAIGLLAGKAFLLWVALGAGLVGSAAFGWRLWRSRPARGETPPVSDPAVAATDGPGGHEVVDAARAKVDQATGAEATAQGAPAVDGEAPEAVVPVGVPTGEPSKVDAIPARTVLVIPGRRRFHLESCRLLVGKATEEISLDEALEEGFTACTACVPDRDEMLSIR